jgi:hypothetical protein
VSLLYQLYEVGGKVDKQIIEDRKRVLQGIFGDTK